jgi:excinuclease ABC subunit A
LKEITFGMQLDRYKVHDIELVIDKIKVNENLRSALRMSVQTALSRAKEPFW